VGEALLIWGPWSGALLDPHQGRRCTQLAPRVRPPRDLRVMDPRSAALSSVAIQLIGYSDSVGNFSKMRFIEKITEVPIIH
jgi:hypothetical protein